MLLLIFYSFLQLIKQLNSKQNSNTIHEPGIVGMAKYDDTPYAHTLIAFYVSHAGARYLLNIRRKTH